MKVLAEVVYYKILRNLRINFIHFRRVERADSKHINYKRFCSSSKLLTLPTELCLSVRDDKIQHKNKARGDDDVFQAARNHNDKLKKTTSTTKVKEAAET